MSDASVDSGRLMDAIYARQRHVYDVTRKFYLLGRDDLIADLRPPPGGSVLEIACGTGRNLVAIARRYTDARCYGLDISSAMLATAHRSVSRAGLASRITLAEADATRFDPAVLFGPVCFDRVAISYALSMMPPWREALHHAAGLLAPGGSLHLVDFGDGRGLPGAFNAALLAWLARFHVAPRHDLPAVAAAVARDFGLQASTRPLYRGLCRGRDARARLTQYPPWSTAARSACTRPSIAARTHSSTATPGWALWCAAHSQPRRCLRKPSWLSASRCRSSGANDAMPRS